MATITKKRPSTRSKSTRAKDYTPLIEDSEIAARIIEITAREFLETRNLDYMIYANTDRAIPLATSGVKLGAQRLLWSMLKDGVKPGAKPRKSAKLAANASGNYHPHASTSTYGTLVSLAQFFARVNPVEGLGSFGMTPGDSPAADRYTEARLSPLGYAMVSEVERGAVPMKATYDNENTEPIYLPVPVPVLLCAGSDGIGNGWATNTPAHNPREVIAAALAVLDDPSITAEELMGHLPGPDWGTGGTVVGGTEGIRSYIETGAGKMTVRGTWHIEGNDIVITEVPPGVSVPTLLLGTKKGKNPRLGINDRVRQGEIPGISDVSDYSDKKSGLRIVVSCKRGADLDQVAHDLLEKTDLECTFGANTVALGPNLVPAWWSVRELIDAFIEMRDSVIKLRSTARIGVLDTAILRAAAVAAVTLDKDKTTEIIRNAEDKAAAASGISAHFGLDDEQGVYIVEMPLYRLTKADTLAAEKRLRDLRAESADLDQLLGDAEARRGVIRDELVESAHLFDDPTYDRRTTLSPEIAAVSGAGLEESDEERLVRWRLDTDSLALGESGEQIHNAHAVWTAFTSGKIKKFYGKGLPKAITVKPVAPDIEAVHSTGLYTPENQDLLLVTAGTNKGSTAKVLRVRTDEMRAQGLAGNGVAGIKLLDGDRLIGCFPASDTDTLLTASDSGFKTVQVADIPVKGTGSQGVGIHKLTKAENTDGGGVLLASVAQAFDVNGSRADPKKVSAAPTRRELASWEAATLTESEMAKLEATLEEKRLDDRESNAE